MNNYFILIDGCIGNSNSHYDIAKFIYEISKDLYKYDSNDNQWYYKNKDNNENAIENLKTFIKSSIVNYFISRSLYYLNLEVANDIQKEENSFKSLKLLEIANNLKKDKFIKDLLKELKQFYQ